jgi:hypothetical protein
MHHSREYVQRAVDAGALDYVLKDAAGHEPRLLIWLAFNWILEVGCCI